MDKLPILSIMIFLPLVGAGVIGLSGNNSSHRIIAKTILILEAGLTLVLFYLFNLSKGGMQFVEQYKWIPSLNVNYHLGIDGLGLFMIFISVFVICISIFSSTIESNTRLYYSLMLLLLTGLLGTFTAQNFVHWFLFWELSLVPAYFLVKIFGGRERVRAATTFFIYTLVGSIAMFICFLALYVCCGTFEFSELARLGQGNLIQNLLSQKINLLGFDINSKFLTLLLFFGILSAFLVKIPLMPFHIWLPLTYSEAPPSITMVLTGVMSKMGLYGLLRIVLPIFPEQLDISRDYLLWFAAGTIVFSAASAMNENNLRKIFAYSSINHLGYCMLAIFAFSGINSAHPFKDFGMAGVILQMINHSINAAALFYFIGVLEKRSGGISDIDSFGGIRRVVPVLCGLMGITMFASLGLPGLNGFVGEFLIFAAVFSVKPLPTIVSVAGLLFTALFILKIIHKVFNGALNEKCAGMQDLNKYEIITIAPSIAMIFIIGIYPAIVFKFINATVAIMR